MLSQKRSTHRLGILEIPEGWTMTTVGEACTIRNDLRLPLSVEIRNGMEGPYPYYGPTGVLDFIAEYRVEGDFALIGEDGDHFLDIKAKPQTIRVSGQFNVNNHAHLIGSSQKCGVDWFFYFFQHRDIFHSLTRQGAGRFKLTKAALEKLPILLPPLSEQRKISEILSTWDHAIEKMKQLIERREHQNRALTHQLVFGRRQLGAFSTSDKVRGHTWFSLPANWDVVPIGTIANEISELNTHCLTTEVLSCLKYDGFVRSLDYFKKQIFSVDLSGYKKIWRGDFGFPSNHVEEGSIGLQNLTDVGVVSPIYTVFRFNPQKIDNAYAHLVLKTGLYKHIFQISTSSSVDRRGSLRWKEFAKIPFPVPSLAEQRAIVNLLAEHRDLVSKATATCDALLRQKRGLMQKLLTGEWRVDSGFHHG
jgi:type I restriction enzyme, S subunit